MDACVQLETAFPRFTVFWFPEWKTPAGQFDTEAGFYAWVNGDEPLHHGRKRKQWYGATAEQLWAKLGG